VTIKKFIVDSESVNNAINRVFADTRNKQQIPPNENAICVQKFDRVKIYKEWKDRKKISKFQYHCGDCGCVDLG
jgi:hypothetical protein